jgi:hypothetical protein
MTSSGVGTDTVSAGVLLIRIVTGKLLAAHGALTAGGLGLIGFGRYSLAAWLGLADRWTPAKAWIALGAGVLAGVANLIMRRRSMTLPEVVSADRHR